MRSSTSGSLEAGPRVATILVLRDTEDPWAGLLIESYRIRAHITRNRVRRESRRTQVPLQRDHRRDRFRSDCVSRMDRGQRPAFQEFEKRAAAGRDVADLLLHAVLGDRGQRVAAAGDRKRRRVRDRLRQVPGAAGERIELEHAHRAVPDDGAGAGDDRLPMRGRWPGRCRGSCRRRPMSAIALTCGAAVAENSCAHDRVRSAPAPCPENRSRMALASPTRSASASDLPILPPDASTNVLAMPPPTISVSTFAASVRRIVSLVETLDPATIATSGRFGCASALPSASSSAASSGPAHATGANFAIAMRGGFGAVRGAEGIVDIDVAELGHALRQRVVVLLLALVHPAVFQQHDLSGRERRVPRAAVDPVANERDFDAQELGEARADRRQRIRGRPRPFGRPSQVRRDHHGGTACERVANGRHRCANPRVVGDRARVVLRHVQVGANEHALAAHVEVGQASKGHGVRCGNRAAAWSRRRPRAPCAPATRRASPPVRRWSAMQS